MSSERNSQRSPFAAVVAAEGVRHAEQAGGFVCFLEIVHAIRQLLDQIVADGQE